MHCPQPITLLNKDTPAQVFPFSKGNPQVHLCKLNLKIDELDVHERFRFIENVFSYEAKIVKSSSIVKHSSIVENNLKTFNIFLTNEGKRGTCLSNFLDVKE